MPDPTVPGDDVPEYAPAAEPAWAHRLSLLTATPSGVTARNVAAAVVLGVAVVVAAVVVLRPPSSPPPELSLPMAGAAPAAPETTTTTAPPDVAVHAAGAVVEPGVYHLAGTARVADLLEAAGGVAPGADLDRMNLAAVLADGARVYVPRLGEPVPAVEGGGDGAARPATGPGGAAAPHADVIVDVNTADATQLEALPGVGPATAAAILDERERRGRFATVEELLEVRGIGDAKLAAMRDLVVAG